MTGHLVRKNLIWCHLMSPSCFTLCNTLLNAAVLLSLELGNHRHSVQLFASGVCVTIAAFENRSCAATVVGVGSESDHSAPSSAEVKTDGAIPPLPHTTLCHSL
jgi:hypothetical protein